MSIRILIVEDEIKLANAMKRALELQKYNVEVAYAGSTGLDMALGEEFDVLILDVMLPEIDGFEICKKVRDEGISTPILMLTAKGQVADKVTGLDAGADDYMLKPFSFDELFARVRALTRRPHVIEKPILEAKELMVDTTTFEVRREGKLIHLSTKEYGLLEYLLRNKNNVLSRDQIINHVWNYDSDILPATVEVHIKHLRDKVDAPFTYPLIHTVRGFGYILKEE